MPGRGHATRGCPRGGHCTTGRSSLILAGPSGTLAPVAEGPLEAPVRPESRSACLCGPGGGDAARSEVQLDTAQILAIWLAKSCPRGIDHACGKRSPSENPPVSSAGASRGGEEVVIARNGEPVARLVSCKRQGKRQFGILKGRIVVDDCFFDPLPEAELSAWEV